MLQREKTGKTGMRFGCCVGVELIGAAADAGYDFVELPAAAVEPEKPEAEIAQVQERLAGAAIKPEVWDSLLPAELKVCGPSVEWPRVARYVNTALRRIAAAGGSVIAFDCGEVCSIPDDFDREEARGQMSDFLRVVGVVGRTHGMIVGIEPVSTGRSDLVNSLPQATEVARLLDMPEVGVLPNCAQMKSEDQSPLDVVDAAAWLAHVHMSAADLEAGGGASEWTRDFIEALRLADYDGRISVEHDWAEPERELRSALESLRDLWEGE